MSKLMRGHVYYGKNAAAESDTAIDFQHLKRNYCSTLHVLDYSTESLISVIKETVRPDMIITLRAWSCTIPVSYTHLDVYKRQHSYEMPMILATSSTPQSAVFQHPMIFFE